MAMFVVALLCVHLQMWHLPLVEGKQDETLVLAEVRDVPLCSGWTVYNSSTGQCVCGSAVRGKVICHLGTGPLTV